MKQEVATGPKAIHLPFVPHWITHPGRLAVATKNASQQHSSVKITVKSNKEAYRTLKQGIHFGDKFHRAQPYSLVGPDTICTACCYSRHEIWLS